MPGRWQNSLGVPEPSSQAERCLSPCCEGCAAGAAMPHRRGHGLSRRRPEQQRGRTQPGTCPGATGQRPLWWHLLGKPQLGKRVVLDHVAAPSAAGHDFTGRLWTLPWESPAVPRTTLERCQWHRAPGQPGAGRGAKPAQPMASQLAPAWLCRPVGLCPALAMELPRCWWGHVPMWGSWE